MPLACVSVLLLLAACQAQPLSEPHTGEEQLLEDEDTVDISTRILSSNNQSDTFLLEGDLLPPTHRNAMKCWYNSCLWPKSSDGLVYVPYIVNSEYNSYETRAHEVSAVSLLLVLLWTILKLTMPLACVSVLLLLAACQAQPLSEPHTGEEQLPEDEDTVDISTRILSAASHTQERGQYIRINWANMNPAMAYNFYRSDTNNLNMPYDYGSIMHYGRTAFSNNGRETLTPLSSSPVNIGQRQALSSWDIKRINLLYSCTGYF
ncbi:high choriolytic enzyme 1-like [Periophthalmus magnuspinnatus]|uniref:high choriolytic enzyme 1-like n=1 Tax=Periophthalmus magnuspinnatus TaxID=409849 RepID=UPI00145A5F5B|nr:high choriolytic enzyme 1-like [Periophthalmus magnuspinnatus]